MATDVLTDEQMAGGGVDRPLTDEEMNAAIMAKTAPTNEARMAKKLKGGIETVGKAATALSDFVDRFNPLGAAYRSAIGRAGSAIANGEPALRAASNAYTDQYGGDPENAPTMKQLAERAGLSSKEEYKVPLVVNPFEGGDQKYMHVSPAGVVGALADTATDPLTYAGEGLAKAPEAAGSAARKLASGLLRVPEKDIIEYAKNGAKIKSAAQAESGSTEAIREKMIADLNQIAEDKRLAAERAKLTASDLETKYKGKQQELKSQRDDQTGFSKNIAAMLDSVKQEQAVASDVADVALDKSGAMISKKDILQLISEAKGQQGKYRIGDNAVKANANLNRTAKRVSKQLPDYVSGADARDIIQQIRNDVSFDLDAGQYDENLGNMRKHISESLSNMLKDQVPEYAATMDKMSPVAENLGKMSAMFGNEKNAVSSLETLRKGTSAHAPRIEGTVKEFTQLTGNDELAKKLAEYKANQQLAEEMKSTDLRSKLFPAEHSAAVDAAADAKMAEDTYAKASKISPTTNQPQNIINRQSFKNPSISERESLQNLSDYNGHDHLDAIKSRNVYDSFDKDRTTGTRMAFMGGSAGAFVGSKLGSPTAGAAIGGILGGMADANGGKWLRAALDLKNSVSDTAVMKLLNNPRFAPYGNVLMKGGPGAVNVYHKMLMNNDPEYRALIEGTNQ